MLHFQNNDEERQRVASAGREYSFEHFSSDAISQFMVEKTMQLPMSRKYVWDDDALPNAKSAATARTLTGSATARLSASRASVERRP